MSFEITILGTSSATPTLFRHPSAQILHFNNRLFLIDCGEGAQLQCMRFGIKFFRLERIFISHLHSDHYLGLPGMLTTMSLQGRTADLHIHGPEGLQEIIDVQFKWSQAYLAYRIFYHELKESPFDTIYEDTNLCVKSFPLDHRLPCWGFHFQEKIQYLKIRKELVQGINLPPEGWHKLRTGQDFTDKEGNLYSSRGLTLLIPPRSYAYITDTLFLEGIARQLKCTDLIYHEATYLNELADKAAGVYHSTALQAAKFAIIAEATQLIIGHFSARYEDVTKLEAESRTIFPDTMAAVEGDTYHILPKDAMEW